MEVAFAIKQTVVIKSSPPPEESAQREVGQPHPVTSCHPSVGGELYFLESDSRELSSLQLSFRASVARERNRDRVYKISIFKLGINQEFFGDIINNVCFDGTFVPYCLVPIPACAGMTKLQRGFLFCDFFAGMEVAFAVKQTVVIKRPLVRAVTQMHTRQVMVRGTNVNIVYCTAGIHDIK